MRAFRAHALFPTSYSPSQFLSPTSSLPVGIFLDQWKNVYRVTHGSLEARRFLTRLK